MFEWKRQHPAQETILDCEFLIMNEGELVLGGDVYAKTFVLRGITDLPLVIIGCNGG
jgi:hypothetical protein